MRRDGGFTLVELLVALVVFALISTLVAAAVRAGLDGARRMEAHAGRLEEVRLSQAFLRRQIGLAEPAFWRDDERRGLAFAGTADRVDFIARASPQLGLGTHAFRLASAPDGVALSWTPAPPDAEDFAFERAPRRLLAAGLGAVRFSYYGAMESGQPALWRDAWSGRALPRLIRIEATAADWPPLVVAPVLGRPDR